jgi:hypothetical protein
MLAQSERVLFGRDESTLPLYSLSRLLDLEFDCQPCLSRQAYQCINAEIIDPSTEQVVEARLNILALKSPPPCGEG